MNILLTSAGRRSYLVRYFKEALIKAGCNGLVHAANSQPCPAFSQADRTVITPLIYDREYIPFLLEYCKNNGITLLLPLFDVDIPVLAANRERFHSLGTRVVTGDPEGVAICNDKWKTHRFLAEAGVRVPYTWLDDKLALEAVKAGRAAWPLMVKPRWGMGSLSVYQAESKEELLVFKGKCLKGIQNSYLRYEAQNQEDKCVLFQQALTGQEYGLDVINDLEGRHRAVIVKEKSSMRSGETDAAVTVENKELEKLGETLGRLLGHRGNLDVDVFCTGGTYYVLEMNARFGGGYPFSHAAGVDLPLALVIWAMNREPDKEILRARPGVRAQKDISMLVW